MQIKVGTYTGDGTDDRSITGVGFQPDFVLTKRRPFGGNHAVIRTADMAGDASKPISSATALSADMIQGLEADGFQVGTDASVNGSGHAYDYLAIKADSADFATGTYTGDGTDDRSITGVGFTPTVVVVMGDTGEQACYKAPGHAGDNSGTFNQGDGGTNLIQAMEADGFQVGSDAKVNANGVTYYYAAWKDASGFADAGGYTGNGVDGRSVSGFGFEPDFCHVGRATGFRDGPVFRTHNHTGDSSSLYSTTGSSSNFIQAFEADGIEVGTSSRVNGDSIEYSYFAFLEGDSQGGGGGLSVPVAQHHRKMMARR